MLCSVVSSSQILVILMMEEIRSSETWVLTRATWRHIPEDGILKETFNSLHSTCYTNRHGVMLLMII
jgi:hypothetical protein